MKVSIGQYIPGNSWIYKIDARAKFVSLFLLMGSLFILPKAFMVSIFLGVLMLLIISARLPFFRLLKAITPLLFIFSITFIFQIFYLKTGDLVYSEIMFITKTNLMIGVIVILFWFFTKKFIKFKFLYFVLLLATLFCLQVYLQNGDVIKIYELSIYEDGLEKASYVIIRLINIVLLSSILTLSTKPLDLNHAIESLLKPFKLIKLPVAEISMMISIAIRFIPTLFDETQKIMKAQASRGVDFTESKLRKKIMQIIALLIPMFIISFKRADDLANAMDARMYVPGAKRTSLFIHKIKIFDIFVILLSLTTLLCSILVFK